MLTFISQSDRFKERKNEKCLGAIVQNIFFSPKEATKNGILMELNQFSYYLEPLKIFAQTEIKVQKAKISNPDIVGSKPQVKIKYSLKEEN